MAFKNLKNTAAIPDSPETLFLDLRNRRVKGLISHQADVLRAYIDKAKDVPDVAFQLPTGSGKTLVGLLLGEWRRRTFEERVIYLCPTKQLVNQVVEQAHKDYGIKVVGLAGSQRDFSHKGKTDYLTSESVAVTTYSGLFNTHPFFTDPNVIILDDAHSAENYIANQWSVRVERFNDDQIDLFKKIVQLFKPHISSTDYQKLTGNEQSQWDKTWVEKIPTPHFYPLIPELVSMIDAGVAALDLRYPWSLIRDNLAACHIYLGSSEILIRSLIPPSEKHLPFSAATQRIYMSATLGEGGDLERLTGRKSIYRLPVPGNWEKQGIGRKLFFFPETSLPQETAEDLVFEMMRSSGRSLVITPDEKNARRFAQKISDKLAFRTFGAREIELSKQAFVVEPQAVAVVANLYDGIDFPNNECRLLVIDNIARATNLQESFFVARMGSAVLLNDRAITRLQQAFGRCTRASIDYAAIVISGGDLFAYLLKPDKRELFHPELQAELKFGIEQSKDCNTQGFLENLQLFLAQGDEWEEPEKHIVNLRATSEQKKPPALSELHDIVKHEIAYQYAMWNEDYAGALESSRKVLTGLTNSDLRGYRAFWLYLSGSAAWLASEVAKIPGRDTVAQKYFEESASTLSTGSLISRLGRMKQNKAGVSSKETDWETVTLIEQLELNLANQGMLHDYTYDRYEKVILDNIMEDDAAKFEFAQVKLGEWLGFQAGNKETNGAPDPWWMVNEDLCFVFEDHSEAQETSSLSVTKARQVATHSNWVKEKLFLNQDANVIAVLVTSVKKADKDASLHLGDACLWNLNEFRDWAKNAIKTVRELRLTFTDIGNLDWRDKAVERYDAEDLSPKRLIAKLRAQPAKDILIEPELS